MALPFVKFHYCEITFCANYIYRLLNNSGSIKLRNIITSDKKTTITVEYSDKAEILSLMERLNIEVLNCKDKGIYTIITRFPVVKGAVAVCMIFVLLMLVNSLFIWKISVEGNYSYSDSQIINFIHKQKIKEGILRTEIDSDKIEKDIRKNFEDISWVCAEIKGTNLIIHIKENYITEISAIEDEPYDIVANRDATIVSVLVRSGSAMVKVGDTVKKGDVLISGVVDVVDESEQKLFSKFCNADGDIVGETVYDYNDSLKINYTKKTTKKTRTIYLPSVLNYRWMKVGEKNKSDIIYSEKSLKMFGNFYLPLSIQKYTIISYTNQPAIYSKEEGWQILNNKLLYKLTVMEQKGYKILKKDVKINKEKDSYVLSGRIVCQELLGTVSYIDMNQYSNQSEEGTTEINERN